MRCSPLLALAGILLSACSHTPPPLAARAPAPPAPTNPPTTAQEPPAPSGMAPAAPSLAELELASNRSLFEALNAHDASALRSLYAPAASVFIGLGLSEAHGPEATAAMAEMLLRAFPDTKVQWSRLLQSGNAVAVELAWTGTSSGTFYDHPPTRKSVGTNALLIEKFDAKGLIEAQHIYVDADNVAVAVGWRPGKSPKFEGLPTSQGLVLDHAVATAEDDVAMRKLASDFLHGAFKDALAAGGDCAAWVDESKGRVTTGKAAVPSWTAFLSRAFAGGGHQLVDVWSTGEYVVEEWSSTSGGPPDSAASHAADVILFEGGKILEVRTYRNAPRQTPR